jgi:hypothetical protein
MSKILTKAHSLAPRSRCWIPTKHGGLATVGIVVVTLLLLLLVTAFFVFRFFLSTVQVQDTRKLEWLDLKASEAVLKKGSVPATWVAGAHISNDVLERMLRLQAGTKATVTGIQDFDDLQLEVRKFEVTSQAGPPRIALDLLASSVKKALSIGLKAEAMIGYRRTEMAGKPLRPHAVFNMMVTSLRPTLSWAGLSMSLPKFTESLVASGAMATYGEKMSFKVPLAETIKVSLGEPESATDTPRKELYTRQMTMPVKDTGGSITLNVTMKNADLDYPISFATPLFGPRGVWLLADDTGFKVPDLGTIATPSDAEIAALRDSVRKLMTEMGESFSPKGDIDLFLNSRALIAMIGKLSSLPEDQRTIAFRSVAVEGNLYNTEWRDDVLGKGGLLVRPANPTFANATAVISPPQVKWLPTIGVKVDSGVMINATAMLHWHFDPLVGGGVGNDVNLGGSALVPLHGQVGVALKEIDGKKVALLLPSATCTNIPISVAASGDIKVSAKLGLLAMEEPLAPTILLDPIPRRIDISTLATAKPVGENRKVDVWPMWKNPVLDVSMLPIEAKATNDGIWISSSVDVQPVKVTDPTYDQDRKALAQKVAENIKAQTRPACPKPDDLRVSIAGIEIGPNGAVVQIVGAAVGIAKSIAKEAEKMAKTPGKALQEAPGNIGREVKKGFCNVFGCKDDQ